MSRVAEESMGGSAGAMYSILFATAAAAASDEGELPIAIIFFKMKNKIFPRIFYLRRRAGPLGGGGGGDEVRRGEVGGQVKKNQVLSYFF